MSSGDLTARGDLAGPRGHRPAPAATDAGAGALLLSIVDGHAAAAVPDRRAALVVPAEPSSLRLVRLVVAGAAADAGFSLDEVEDVRVAADEACGAVLVAVGGGPSVDLVVEVGVDRGGDAPVLRVDVRSEPPTPPVVEPVPALLLQHTTDDWSVDGDHLGFRRTRTARAVNRV